VRNAREAKKVVGGYRYGFNGKENDNEVKGEGNQIDYGMRVYDPRIGKFLSVDPLRSKYPWYTPYQFSGNTPIQAVDIDGREDIHYVFVWVKAASGKETVLKLTGWSEGNETGQVDAQGRAVYDRPYKVHAHYPVNVYGRTVFANATYNSEQEFNNAKESDFYGSAFTVGADLGAEMANEFGGALTMSYVLAKVGSLSAKALSMYVEAKTAQYTANLVNKAAINNLVKENVSSTLEKAGVTVREVAKAETKSFFDGTRYTSKVLGQMKNADYHAFPESVKAFESSGTVTTITGGDGVTRQMLKIPGEYGGKKGMFEFIKESDGSINHRLFRPNQSNQ